MASLAASRPACRFLSDACSPRVVSGFSDVSWRILGGLQTALGFSEDGTFVVISPTQRNARGIDGRKPQQCEKSLCRNTFRRALTLVVRFISPESEQWLWERTFLEESNVDSNDML